jgi:hypothetical protein
LNDNIEFAGDDFASGEFLFRIEQLEWGENLLKMNFNYYFEIHLDIGNFQLELH